VLCEGFSVQLRGKQHLAIALGLSLAFFGCGPADVVFTFDNRTDVLLCDFPTAPDAERSDCLVPLAPHSETRSGRDCDNRSGRLIRVIIALEAGRRVIYDRTATCGAWHDSSRRLVIEERGDDLAVTDDLDE
jgi:hypothetical protein